MQHIATALVHAGIERFRVSIHPGMASWLDQASAQLLTFHFHRRTGSRNRRYRSQLSLSGWAMEMRRSQSRQDCPCTLPTGDWKKSRGAGGTGISAAIPVSYVVNPVLVTHFDLGAGVIPSARGVSGDRSRILNWTTAGSAIITASNRIQPMLEAVYLRGQTVVGRDRTARSESVLVSPGVRGAFNFRSGLQIVPGIAFPIGVGVSKGQRYAFFYLSFEHPFNKRAGQKIDRPSLDRA